VFTLPSNASHLSERFFHNGGGINKKFNFTLEILRAPVFTGE